MPESGGGDRKLPHAIAKRSARTRLLLALLALAIVVLHVGTVGHGSLRNREFITLRVVEQGYVETVVERVERNHMPLYFVGLKLWIDAFGVSDVTLRMPSALASLAGLFFVWRLARRLHGGRWALLALAFAGFNQIHLKMSADARMYSLLFATVAAVVYFAVRTLESGRARDQAWLALWSATSIAVHLLSLLSLLPLALWTGLREQARAGRGRTLGALLGPVLLLSPVVVWWALVQDQVGHNAAWSLPPIDAPFRQLCEIFLGDDFYIRGLDPKVVTFPLFALTAWLTLRPFFGRGGAPANRGNDRPFRFDALFWWLCLAPALAVLLADLKAEQPLSLSWRYLVGAAPVAPLLLVSAIRRLAASGRSRLAAGYGAAVFVTIASCSVAYLVDPGVGVREIVRYLNEHRRPAEALLASHTPPYHRAFAHYGHAPAEPEVPPAGSSRDELEAWLDARIETAPVFWVVYYPQPGFDEDPFRKLLEERREHVPRSGQPLRVGETVLVRHEPVHPNPQGAASP